jgi:hypothetical protein
MRLSPLQRFLLAVLAWLPLCFFFWWWVSGVWLWVPVHLAAVVLTHGWPTLFEAVVQHGAEMEVATRVLVNAGPGMPGGAGQLLLTPNPLAYGYALPLYVALVLATPLEEDRRWRQLLLGVGAIWLAQAFGVVTECLKLLGFDSGDVGTAAIASAGLNREAIALCYQFGYLILPAVLPPVLWLGQNRPFIDSLTGRVAEPAADNQGHS